MILKDRTVIDYWLANSFNRSLSVENYEFFVSLCGVPTNKNGDIIKLEDSHLALIDKINAYKTEEP